MEEKEGIQIKYNFPLIRVVYQTNILQFSIEMNEKKNKK